MTRGALLCLTSGLGLACGSGQGPVAGDVTSSASVTRLATDENGVTIAGGETSDFGSGDIDQPILCGFVETQELSVDAARSLGHRSIDAGLALFERQYAAPFHWGYCDEGCIQSGGASEDTRIVLQLEPLTVYRSVFEPPPDFPDVVCPEPLSYRAVIDLASDDGRIQGRFYARLRHIDFEDGVQLGVDRLKPDLRNFQGSLNVPLDLARPHWGAMFTTFRVGDGRFSGNFEAEINYSDDVLPGSEFNTGAGGFWPARFPTIDRMEGSLPYFQDGMALHASAGAEPLPAGSQPVRLNDYAGSAVTPTCAVHVTTHLSSELAIYVDGVPTQGVPSATTSSRELGRLPAETLIRVEARNWYPGTPGDGLMFLPGAGAIIAVYPELSEGECEEPGCVAQVEHRITSYCSE